MAGAESLARLAELGWSRDVVCPSKGSRTGGAEPGKLQSLRRREMKAMV